MSDVPPIAERLRDVPRYLAAELKHGPWGVCLDAADAIEALLEALEEVAKGCPQGGTFQGPSAKDWANWAQIMVEEARAAIAKVRG
jgi:hypothetical protein